MAESLIPLQVPIFPALPIAGSDGQVVETPAGPYIYIGATNTWTQLIGGGSGADDMAQAMAFWLGN